ncbi:MAG: hypothetical protein AAF825_11560 [Pseudomonadota bacterium]
MSRQESVLELQLYGPMRLRWRSGDEVSGLGAKQKALIAMLAQAPGLSHSRAWLIANLWGRVDQKLGRSSLRQALSAMRQKIGPEFDHVFEVGPDMVGLRADAIARLGDSSHGEFLEGIDIDEEGFEDWLREQRAILPLPAQAAPPRVLAHDESLHPRVAVLPLAGIGLGPHFESVGDFFAQELIRALSRLHLLDVISHLSSRIVGGETVDLAQIRDRLTVDYVVNGSVRMIGGRLVINVDCHDCQKGTHLWDARYSLPEEALFTTGDGILSEIAGEVLQTILSQPVETSHQRPLPSVATHRLLMSAISLMYSVAERQFGEAHARLEELARRAPTHSVPQAWFAQWHLLRIYQGWSEDPKADRLSAEDHISTGLDLNPSCALTLAMDGNVKTVLNADFSAAAESFSAARAANNSSALTSSFHSVLHTFMGDGAAAIAQAERSVVLSPCDPRRHFFDTLHSAAYLVGGDYQRAVELADASLRVSPRHVSAQRSRIVGLTLGGRLEEAQVAARDLLRLTPDITVSGYLENHPARGTGVAETWADALGRAGIPAQ